MVARRLIESSGRGLLSWLALHFPAMGVIAGIGVAILGGAGMAYFWDKIQQRPAAPLALLIADVPAQVGQDRVWVTLRDGTWDCTTMDYTTTIHRTGAVLLDDARSVAVRVVFDKKLACEQLPTGGISGDIFRVNHRDQLAQYGEKTERFELCSYCGVNNDKYGLIACGMFTVCGAVFAGISVKVFRARAASRCAFSELDQGIAYGHKLV